MRVGYGRTLPEGFLPVFSVNTEEEAQTLIIMTCPRDGAGNFYARELVEDQSLENLQRFSDKLALAWDRLQERKKQQNAEADPSASKTEQTR